MALSPNRMYRVIRVLCLILILSPLPLLTFQVKPAYADITYVGVGTATLTHSDGNYTPALHASATTGDTVIVIAHATSTTGGSLSISAGWTAITNSQTTGGLFGVWYRALQAGDSAPTVTVSGINSGGNPNGRDAVIIQTAAWRGVDTSDPLDVTGTLSVNGAQANIGAITGISLAASDVVIVVGGKRDDWTSVATLSGDSLTWNEIAEPANTEGIDNGMVWDYAIDGGSGTTVTSKTFTVTGGTNQAGVGIMFSLNVQQAQQFNRTPGDTVTTSPSLTAFKNNPRSAGDSLVTTESVEVVIPIRHIGNSGVSGSSGSTGQCVIPSAAADGDLMICATYTNHLGATISVTSPPSGWTGIEDAAVTNSGSVHIFYRVKQSGDTNQSFTLSTSAGKIYQTTAIRYAHATNPIAAYGTLTGNTAQLDIGPITGIEAEEYSMIFVIGGKVSDNVDSGVVSALTGDGISWNEISETTFAATDVARVWDYGRNGSSPTTITAKTFDYASGSTVAGAGYMFAIRNAAVSAGPQEYNRTPSDTVTTTPTVERLLDALRTDGDTITTSDSLDTQYIAVASAADTITITEMLGTLYHGFMTPSDAIATSDSIRTLVTRKADDTITVSDNVSAGLLFTRTVDDTITTTDSVSTVITYDRDISDSTTTSDMISISLDAERTASDSITTNDNVSVIKDLIRTINDSIIVSDSVTGTVVLHASIGDSITVVDGIDRQGNILKALADSITTTDNIVATAEHSVDIDDSIQVTDSVDKGFVITRQINDSITTADSVDTIYHAASSISDSVTVSDTSSRMIDVTKEIPDSVTISESIQITSIRTITDSVTVVDSVDRDAAQTAQPSDSITTVDTVTVIYHAVTSVSDSITIVDSVSRVVDISKAVNDSITVQDDVQRGIATTVQPNDTITTNGSVTIELVISRSIGDSISVQDNVDVMLTAFRMLSDSVTVSDTVTGSTSFEVSPNDSITTSDSITIVKAISTTLFDSITTTDSIETTYTAMIDLGDNVQVVDSIDTSLAGSASLSDSITVSDSVSTERVAVVTISDTVTVADSIDTVAILAVTIGDNVSVTDTVDPHVPQIQVFINDVLNLIDRIYDPNRVVPSPGGDDCLLIVNRFCV